MELYIRLIEKIKKEREILQIYQNEMASVLDVDVRTYRNIEKGDSNLSLPQFLLICKKMNREPAYFFDSSNSYTYNNCTYSNNSGNHNNYNQTSKEMLSMLIEALNEKLKTIQQI